MSDELAVSQFGFVAIRVVWVAIGTPPIASEVWDAVGAGIDGYNTGLLATVALVATIYMVMWPYAVIRAVLIGEAVHPSRWLWLPLAAISGPWFRPRGKIQRPSMMPFRFWVSTATQLLTSPVSVPWWGLEAWLDQRSVRRCRRDRVMNAEDLRELLARLRHPSGVNALVSALRRQELRCDPGAVQVLEELAARADAAAPQPWRLSPDLRRADWARRPGRLPERAIDQITLISDARLRASGQAAVQTSAAGGTEVAA